MEYISLPKLDKKDALPVASLAIAVSIVYTSYRMFLSNQEKKHTFKKIPVPGSAYPYIGHMMSLGELPGRTIQKWHKELGPIINLKMGIQNWIAVDDPVLAHKIFVTNGIDTSYRPHNAYAFNILCSGGKGVSFSQPNGRWKVTRSAILNLLSPKYIEKHIPTISSGSRKLVSDFIECTMREGGVNPYKYAQLFGMNNIFGALFGRTFPSVEDPEFIKLLHLAETITTCLALENDLPNYFPILSVYEYFFKSQDEQKRFLENEYYPFFRKFVKEAYEAEGSNFIKSLTEEGPKLSEDETMHVALDLIVAGTDTIPVSLFWIIAIMCHHPDVQKKVTTEIDDFIKLNKCLPSFHDRSQLPYCISTVKECMRFRPTTSLGLPHTTRRDILVDDYMIPKGSVIIPSMESMHMRSDVYAEPERFMPERFINNLKTMYSAANGKLEERDHYSFGWGRRICPAINFAEAEVFSAFIQVFSECYIEPASEIFPDLDSGVNLGIAVSPVSYKVKLIKRESIYK
ncbi:cytochrome P450 [Helicostylum pulchrum]|nr:cytochrome P450 [Helicostylum pulchrum]